MRIAALVLLAAAACGPSVSTGPAADTGPGEVEADPAPDPAAAPEPEPETGPDAPAGAVEVERAALIAVLDGGVGTFLGGVQIEPHFAGQRFDGWQVVSFWPGDPRFAAVNLRPGDVVREVNGRPIQQPDQLFKVWTQLRTADTIVVTGSRQGQPLELRFHVVGPAPPPAKP